VAAALCTLLLRIETAQVAERRARIEAQWAPLILDVLNGEIPPTAVTPWVQPRDLPYFIEFLGRFVRRLTGPEQGRLIYLAEPLLPYLRRSLASRSPERRAHAVDTLGLLCPSTGSPELRAALDDPSPFVAMVAARALTRAGQAEHVDALIARLHRFQEWRPSYLAAMLTALGPAAVPALLASFADGTTPARVRIVAADALGRLNAAVAADTAARVAAEPGEPELGAAALRLLGRVGHAPHLPVVRASLTAPAEGIRLAAARALALLGGPGDLPLLLRALDDPSRWVAEQAARGLLALEGRGQLTAIAAGTAPVALIAREVLADRVS
jgi:HEAT repeat protein